MSIQSTLDTILNQSSIVVFSKPMCVLCDKVKQELKDSRSNFLEINITTMEDDYNVDPYDIVSELKNRSQSNFYPFCFQNTEYIDTEKLIKNLMNNKGNIDDL